jgi:hypothetical protein
MSDDAVESTSSMRELRYAKVLIGGGVGVVGWCCWVVLLGGVVGWCCWVVLLGGVVGWCCWVVLLGGVVGWWCWVVVLGGGVGWFEVCKGAEVCNVRCAKSVNK